MTTLDGELAKALLAIPAVKGVEFGAGFAAARLKGSENNDAFTIKNGKIVTTTNNAGGILGGISNGMPLVVRAAVKPTSSIAIEQATVDIEKMKETTITVGGRHDVCIVPRAVPVVEAMIAVTLADFALRAGLIPEGVEMNIDDLRKKIDAIDARIVALIAERQNISKEIGKGKHKTSRLIEDRERELRVLEHVRGLARDKKISPAISRASTGR